MKCQMLLLRLYTDNEYAIIVNPLPGEYKVKTIGTDNGGKYTIVADYIDIQGDMSAEESGVTEPGQFIENSLNLSTEDRIIEIESPDIMPPEAIISADILAKDLVITGLDDTSASTVTKAANTTIITDEAGNKTTLTFKKTWSGRTLTYARLMSIKYGTGAPVLSPPPSHTCGTPAPTPDPFQPDGYCRQNICSPRYLRQKEKQNDHNRTQEKYSYPNNCGKWARYNQTHHR